MLVRRSASYSSNRTRTQSRCTVNNNQRIRNACQNVVIRFFTVFSAVASAAYWRKLFDYRPPEIRLIERHAWRAGTSLLSVSVFVSCAFSTFLRAPIKPRIWLLLWFLWEKKWYKLCLHDVSQLTSNRNHRVTRHRSSHHSIRSILLAIFENSSRENIVTNCALFRLKPFNVTTRHRFDWEYIC